jgi:WD40 repeat protein
MAWSPDGSRIAVGCGDGLVRIWDAAPPGNLMSTLKGHTAWVRGVSWNPAGTRVTSTAADGTVKIWDTAQKDEPWLLESNAGVPPLVKGDELVNLAEAPVWRGPALATKAEHAAGDELSALKFGFPSVVHLPGGDVLAVFWCPEECLHTIRWVRLKV